MNELTCWRIQTFYESSHYNFLVNSKEFLQIWVEPHINFFNILNHQVSNGLILHITYSCVQHDVKLFF